MEFFTRKLGPLPVWAYAALAVGGFVVLRLRSKASTGAQPQPSLPYGSMMGGPQYMPLNLPPAGGGLPVTAIPTTANISTPDPTTTGSDGAGTTSVSNAPASAPQPINNPYSALDTSIMQNVTTVNGVPVIHFPH